MTGGPLRGRRLVVTRRPEQSGELSRALTDLGAEVVELPTIAIAPPADCGPLDDALRRLASFDWLVFTSANAVAAVRDRLAALGLAPPAPAPRGASVGEATTAACREALPWLELALQPERDFRAEGLLQAFEAVDVRGASMLVPLSERARDVLVAGLEPAERGSRRPSPIAPWRRPAWPSGMPSSRGPASTCWSSPRPPRSGTWPRRWGEPTLRGRAAAVIGPVTEEAAHKAGLDVRVRAEPSTASGLVAALARRYGRAG